MLEPKNLTNGEEQYEEYYSSILKKNLVQYDYRHFNGKLFSCVKPSLERCRLARDEWIENSGHAVTSK